jgi:hypothetical protein
MQGRLDAIIQWSLKVREMYLDIESRREDAREAPSTRSTGSSRRGSSSATSSRR